MTSNETLCKRLITAREAEAYIPRLEDYVGNDEARNYLLSRLAHPPEGDANVLFTGVPGSAKTSMFHSYLRERFENPLFYNGDVEQARGDEEARSHAIQRSVLAKSDYDIRFFQITSSGMQYAFVRIDGASDSAKVLEVKVRDAMNNSAEHTFVFVDELGELYFRGMEEGLRPVMTAADITTFATAQNFHSKRRTDSSKEQDDRLRALIRRFPRVIETENPSESDLIRFLAKRIHEWSLTIDHPSTLRLLAVKSGGVVGFALRSLIRAIDEPDRRLTRPQVMRDDPDPLNR
jgi:hypothetical protein